MLDHVIRIGKYPQNEEDQADPVEWIVLKMDDKTMLLISRYALITSPYCEYEQVQQDLSFLEWEKSLARERCRQFYETAFSREEKELLVPRQSPDGESDPVFLLTEEEVKELLPDLNIRKARPTLCALEQGARLGWTADTRDDTSWWIMPEIQKMEMGRSYSAKGLEYHGRKEIFPKAVFQTGDIQYHSRNIYHTDFTIRPCICISCARFCRYVIENHLL